jgi:hypothetical protein
MNKHELIYIFLSNRKVTKIIIEITAFFIDFLMLDFVKPPYIAQALLG